MSLILDALNRADRERKNTQVTPDITTVHEITYRPEATPGSKKILLITVIVLVLAVLLLGYSVLQNRTAPDAVATSPHIIPSMQSANPLPNPTGAGSHSVPAAEPVAASTPTPADDTVPVAPALPERQSTQRASVPPAEVNSLYAKEKNETKKIVTQTEVNELYKPVEEPAVVTSVALEAQKIIPVSLVEKSNKTYAALDVPDLSQLPVGLQQEIPSIIYSQHNFATEGTSNVVLNGQPRLARTMISAQLSLDEIYVDGILLRFREHKFKLRALNNWVNM